jgi:hypothetical protein
MARDSIVHGGWSSLTFFSSIELVSSPKSSAKDARSSGWKAASAGTFDFPSPSSQFLFPRLDLRSRFAVMATPNIDLSPAMKNLTGSGRASEPQAGPTLERHESSRCKSKEASAVFRIQRGGV